MTFQWRRLVFFVAFFLGSLLLTRFSENRNITNLSQPRPEVSDAQNSPHSPSPSVTPLAQQASLPDAKPWKRPLHFFQEATGGILFRELFDSTQNFSQVEIQDISDRLRSPFPAKTQSHHADPWQKELRHRLGLLRALFLQSAQQKIPLTWETGLSSLYRDLGTDEEQPWPLRREALHNISSLSQSFFSDLEREQFLARIDKRVLDLAGVSDEELLTRAQP